MESTVKKSKERVSKSIQKSIVKPLKKRGGLGILKGKIHYKGDVFNLAE
jgi:dihydroxyacid dehydratase/phosphogluconate dehydratase